MQLKLEKAIFNVNYYPKTNENNKILIHRFTTDSRPDIL